MKIEKDTVTFEAPDADFVTKFGIQAAADMVLDFHCFHPQTGRHAFSFRSTGKKRFASATCCLCRGTQGKRADEG